MSFQPAESARGTLLLCSVAQRRLSSASPPPTRQLQVLDDSIDALRLITVSALKAKRLLVTFTDGDAAPPAAAAGAAAAGAAGAAMEQEEALAREWISLFARAAFDPAAGLFAPCAWHGDQGGGATAAAASGFLEPNQNADSKRFVFLGLVLGKAVQEGFTAEAAHLSLAVRKRILGQKPAAATLKARRSGRRRRRRRPPPEKPLLSWAGCGVDPLLAGSSPPMQDLVSKDPPCFSHLTRVMECGDAAALGLTFSLDGHELKPGGKALAVTEDNKGEYVALAVAHRMVCGAAEAQVKELCRVRRQQGAELRRRRLPCPACCVRESPPLQPVLRSSE